MTYMPDRIGRNEFYELTRDPGRTPYVTKRSLKGHEKMLHNEAKLGKFFGKFYKWVLHYGLYGTPGDAETPRGRAICTGFIPVVLGAGVCSAINYTESATGPIHVDSILSIGGNMSDESPLPEDYLVADGGIPYKIGPGLTFLAMVAENESEKLLRVEKEAAEIINLGGEHKLPIDISEYADADWSEVIEWDGKLHWPDSSMGRAEEGKMYIPKLIPLTDEEESYYRNIYDGPKKPVDNRIFDDEIAIK